MTYTSPHGFSFTIDAPPDAGTTAVDRRRPGHLPRRRRCEAPASRSATYTQTFAPGRDAFDVTCPSGESHHFNLDEILQARPARTAARPASAAPWST